MIAIVSKQESLRDLEAPHPPTRRGCGDGAAEVHPPRSGASRSQAGTRRLRAAGRVLRLRSLAGEHGQPHPLPGCCFWSARNPHTRTLPRIYHVWGRRPPSTRREGSHEGTSGDGQPWLLDPVRPYPYANLTFPLFQHYKPKDRISTGKYLLRAFSFIIYRF